MSSNIKTAKRGELIFKEGDKITSVILIQSGSTQLCLPRHKKNIEVFTVGPSQILGEQTFLGGANHGFSLIATSEAKYMEIPVDIVKSQIEAAPQFLKIVIRSLADRLKVALSDVKTSRLEKDASPCPEDQVAKIYGSIFHCISKKGKAEDPKIPNVLTIDWVQFRQYCQRIFGESPKRLEQAVQLLVKLKFCSYVMGKSIDDPEGPDEVQKVNFHDLPLIESFFEFYQYYYFKGSSGSSAGILKYDETSYHYISYFLKMAETTKPDRFGVVAFEMSKAVEFFKSEFGINLGQGHFVQLENKGVFAKRQSKEDGSVTISFELKEWLTTQKMWGIIKEIEKWNEKGFIDMHEEEVVLKKKSTGPTCPSCAADINPAAKFCAECGTKIDVQGKTGGSGGTPPAGGAAPTGTTAA